MLLVAPPGDAGCSDRVANDSAKCSVAIFAATPAPKPGAKAEQCRAPNLPEIDATASEHLAKYVVRACRRTAHDGTADQTGR